jgi:hypothetical protein
LVLVVLVVQQLQQMVLKIPEQMDRALHLAGMPYRMPH